MTKVELPDATINTIVYDGDGKRRSYEDSVMLRKFIWDEENIFRQTGADGVTNRDYTYNPQYYGELVSQAGLFHHYDALGSTMQLTEATQSAVVSYLYRAFGEQSVLSGSSASRFNWLGRWGYYRQPDTSDYWVRARVYRPQIGRWGSRDPLSRGEIPDHAGTFSAQPELVDNGSFWRVDAHPYLYGTNGPVVRVDPSGWYKILPSCKKWETQIQRHMDAVCGSIDSCCLSEQEKRALKQRCRKAKIGCDGYWCGFTAFGRLEYPQAYSKRGTVVLCSKGGGVGENAITWWYLAHEMGHQIHGRSEKKADEVADACQQVGDLPCVQSWFTGESSRPVSPRKRKAQKKQRCS